jgi:nucleobase:cation symporter-1, NCS1 family
MEQTKPSTSCAEPNAGSLVIEGRSIDYIPESERHGKLSSQGPFWFLGNFTFLTISLGFVGPGMGLSAWWTTVAGALGVMFGTIFMAFHGSQGPEMGLPQMIQSRAQFGYRGVIIALAATIFVFVGFNVVAVTLITDGMSSVFHLDRVTVACGVVAVGSLISIFGHDLLHRAFKWALTAALPLYALVTIAAIIGVRQPHAVPAAELGFKWVAFATQFAIAASYNISYAPFVSDYSRYLPKHTSRPKLIAAVFLGASLSGAWMIGLGAWLAQQLRTEDAFVALNLAGTSLMPGLGGVFVMVAVVACIPLIGLNSYSAMLTLLTAIDSFRKITPTSSARVIAIIANSALALLCALSIGGNGIALLNVFMTVLLYFLVPWTAVNLVDYFFVRKGQYAISHLFTSKGIYGNWQVRGIAAYLVGFVVMIPFFNVFDATNNKDVFVGPLARELHGVDVAWLIGLIVSGVLYYILGRSLDLDAEREVIASIKESDLVGMTRRD